MFFEDGSERTLAAIRLLESQRDALKCPGLTIQPVEEFLSFAKSMRLTRHEKEVIVDQATLLIDQFYAHLPFKRARYAADPVQRLRLIHSRLGEMTDLEFHEQMIRAFIRLRDAHTFYGLPVPYRGAFAFLPFEVDRFHDKSGRRRFVVKKVLEGFDHPEFGPGAEITLWSGMPVERAIQRAGESDPGGNAASRFLRGLNRMTNRPLAYSVPPDEHFVVIQYVPVTGRAEQSIVLPWHVAMEGVPHKKRHGDKASVSESTSDILRIGKILWRRAESKDPQTLEFRQLLDARHPDKRFAYLRIRTFEVDSQEFVAEFGRVLDHLQDTAPDGLVLDVRSNPGGAIEAAERILQFLTPGQVRPANFHFVNSRLTQHVAANLKRESGKAALGGHEREWLPWMDDLLDSTSSGSMLTPGRPLTNPDDANDTGQRYQGPVVLIIDALAYSATDIFAGGFQDHQIGKIIGVDENTGGGGANRWLHEELRVKLEHLPGVALKQLPGDAQIGLAIRRSSRVGASAGHPIEDLGVTRDVRYQLTRDDIMHDDRDLLQFACGQLATQPANRLKILKAELQQGSIALTVETRNLFRIECLVNGLQQSAFATDAPQPYQVPTAALLDAPAQIRVNGFANVDGEIKLVVTAAFEFAD
jgi:hypothetical protein